MDYVEEFLQATEKCIEQLRLMLPMETEKRQALLSDDTNQLEEIMASQQAAMMKLNQLESTRLECQKKAGFEGMDADEVLQAAPDSMRERCAACFSDLRKTAEELRLLNAKAMEIAKASVQFFESMERNKAKPVGKVTYGVKGPSGSSWGNGSSFEKKI